MTTTEDPLRAAAARAFQGGFGAVIRIDVEGREAIFVDGRGDVVQFPQDCEATPDLVWRSTPETLQAVFDRKRALQSAYLSGRLKIAGDVSVMARLKMAGK